MSDLTNTPKRERPYGSAAERFNAEQALGRATLAILNLKELPANFEGDGKIAALRAEAKRLGLLPEGGPR